MILISVLSGEHVGQKFQRDLDVLSIGSSDDNTVVLSDGVVCPKHLRVLQNPEQTVVEILPEATAVSVSWGGNSHTVVPGDLLAIPDLKTILVELSDESSHVRFELLVRPTEGSQVLSTRQMGDLEPVRQGLQRDQQVFNKLERVQRKVVSSVELDDVLEAIADGVLELLPGATHVTIALRGERPVSEPADAASSHSSGLVVPVLTRVRGESGIGTSPDGPVPVARSVVRKVLRERAAVLAADAPKEVGKAQSLLGASIRSTVAVPLWKNDEIIGAIQADNRTAPAMLRASDLDILAVFASSASLAVSNARLVRDLRIAHDQLRRENELLRSSQGTGSRSKKIIGSSEPIRQLLHNIQKVASTRVTVLIEGETGTGKELVASAIHDQSPRAAKMFVVQNCAAFPNELLESELFGHKRGAFTGAVEDKKGLFDLANGGTLFLDEVGELPLNLQSKLLRVLQEGEVRPIGEGRPHHVDVRIVAATNRDLKDEVDRGRFRQDLFYRLRVFPVRVPPLRERREDIPELANAFVEQYAKEIGKHVAGFSQTALELMKAYDWPGNVRELQNEVQRLVILADEGQYLVPELLSGHVRGDKGLVAEAGVTKGPLKQMMAQVEKYLLIQALREHGNNKTQTARALAITREGLHKKLRAYGIK